jgi:hypothetical protein
MKTCIRLLFSLLFMGIQSAFTQQYFVVPADYDPIPSPAPTYPLIGSAQLYSSTDIIASSIVWKLGTTVVQNGGLTAGNLARGAYTVTFNKSNNETISLGFNVYDINIDTTEMWNCHIYDLPLVLADNSSNPATCDGDYVALSNNWDIYSNTYTYTSPTYPSFNQTIQSVPGDSPSLWNVLCPGTYCTRIETGNGCTFHSCDIVGSIIAAGDTMFFFNAGCNSPVSTLMTSVEGCQIDINAVDTVYLTNALMDSNGSGEIWTWWNVVDTNGLVTSINPVFTNNSFGSNCYEFFLTIYCYQKSMNYKSIAVHQSFNVNEYLNLDVQSPIEKQIVRVTDIMGIDCPMTSQKLLIVTYNDGSVGKIFLE